jgi:glycosyltransferase involved in cell wall biosynthesis
MKLSVYTITCNQFSYFNDILLSVDDYARSDCKDELEFIVLDTSDESTQIKVLSRLREISKNWDEKIIIKYYPYEKDPGLYNTRLDAVNHCTGDYIACVDGDDFFQGHAFETIINCLHTHPDYDIYRLSFKYICDIGYCYFVEDQHVYKHNKVINLDKHFDLSVLENKELTENVYLWSYVVKSSVYKSAISKLPRLHNHIFYGEDVIISFVIFANSKSIYGIEDEIYNKRCVVSSSLSISGWLCRSKESILAFDLVKIIYNIIDDPNNKEIFKNSDIKNNVRRIIIGLLRENDLEYILHNQNKLNMTDIINEFESVYGKGSWKFLNNLGKTRMLPHERPLVDKYGLGV